MKQKLEADMEAEERREHFQKSEWLAMARQGDVKYHRRGGLQRVRQRAPPERP